MFGFDAKGPVIPANMVGRTVPQIIEKEKSKKLGRPKIAKKEEIENSEKTTPTFNFPSQRVNFDLGKAGRINAYYHAVILEPTCIVLIFDSSCTVAHQYEPPVLAEVMNLIFDNKTYPVISMGLCFTSTEDDHFYTVLVRAEALKDKSEEDELIVDEI